MASELGKEPQTRLINGALMSLYEKKEAIMWGEVTSKAPNGRVITIKTPDNAYVRVELQNQPMPDVEQGQWIQANGIVANKTTLNAKKVIVFPREYTQDMDTNAYNALVKIHQTHGLKYYLYEVDENLKDALPLSLNEQMPYLEVGDDTANATMNASVAGDSTMLE